LFDNKKEKDFINSALISTFELLAFATFVGGL